MAMLGSRRPDETTMPQSQGALSDPHSRPKADVRLKCSKAAWKQFRSGRCRSCLSSHSHLMVYDDEQGDVPASLVVESASLDLAAAAKWVALSEASRVSVGEDQ